MNYNSTTGTFTNDWLSKEAEKERQKNIASTNEIIYTLPNTGWQARQPASGRSGTGLTFQDEAYSLGLGSPRDRSSDTSSSNSNTNTSNTNTRNLSLKLNWANTVGATKTAVTKSMPYSAKAYQYLRAANGGTKDQVIENLVAKWKSGRKLSADEINALKYFRPDLFPNNETSSGEMPYSGSWATNDWAYTSGWGQS